MSRAKETGRTIDVPITPKDKWTAPRSREERESRERDAWAYVQAQRIKHDKLTPRQAENEARKAREQEHARKREKGEDY